MYERNCPPKVVRAVGIRTIFAQLYNAWRHPMGLGAVGRRLSRAVLEGAGECVRPDATERLTSMAVRRLGGQGLLELGGKLFCLLVGELQLTVEDEGQLVGAGILELSFQESGGSCAAGGRMDLRSAPCCSAESNYCGDLIAQRGAQIAGAEHVAKEAFGFDMGDFGCKP